MPVVPTYQESVLPRVGAQPAEFQDFSGKVIRPKTPQPGEYLRVALAFREKVEKEKAEQEEVRIAEAKNKLTRFMTDRAYGAADPTTGERKGGWRSLKGKDALVPDKDGRSIADVEDSETEKQINALIAELPNDKSKQRFRDQAGAMREQNYSLIRGHMLNEDQRYKEQTYKAAVTDSVDRSVLAVGSPDAYALSIKAVGESARADAMRQGLGEGVARSAAETAVSKTHLLALSTLLQQAANDPWKVKAAQDFFQTYKSQMRGDDLLQANTALDKAQRAFDNASLVDTTVKNFNVLNQSGKRVELTAAEASRYAPEAVRLSIRAIESGGHQFTGDGQILVGRDEKGNAPSDWEAVAYGAMQINNYALKDINAWQRSHGEREFTLEEIKSNQIANEQAGSIFLNILFQRYDGDIEKAVVAYNQGSGNLAKVLKEAEKAGDSWKNHLTEGGKKYLERFRKEFAKRTGANISKDVPRDTQGNPISVADPLFYQKNGMEVTQDEVRSFLLKREPSLKLDPTRLEELTTSAYRQIQDKEKDRQTQLKNAVAAVDNVLWETRGDLTKVTEEQWAQLTPTAQMQLRDIAKRYAVQETVTSNKPLLYRLLKDPEYLASMDETSYNMALHQFSKEDAATVERLRIELLTERDVANRSWGKDRAANAQGAVLTKHMPKWDDVQRMASAVLPNWYSWKTDQKDHATLMLQQYIATRYVADPSLKDDYNAKVGLAREFFSHQYDTGTFFSSYKNYAQLSVGDLSDKGPADVRSVITKFAKLRLDKAGAVGRDPTPNEIVEAFIDLDTRRQLEFPIPDQFMNILSPERVKMVKEQIRKNYGERVRPDNFMVLKYYVRSLMLKEKVASDRDPGTSTADQILGTASQALDALGNTIPGGGGGGKPSEAPKAEPPKVADPLAKPPVEYPFDASGEDKGSGSFWDRDNHNSL